MNDLTLLEEFKSDLPRPDHIPPVSTVTKRANRARALQVAATVAVVGVLAVAIPAVAEMAPGRQGSGTPDAAAVLASIQTRPPGQYVHMSARVAMSGTGVPAQPGQLAEADLDGVHHLIRVRQGGTETIVTNDAIYEKKPADSGWVRYTSPNAFDAYMQRGGLVSTDPNSLLKDLTAKQVGHGLKDGGIIDGEPTWRFDLDPKKFLGKEPGALGAGMDQVLKGSVFRVWVGRDGELRRLEMRFSSAEGQYSFGIDMVMNFTQWGVPVTIAVPEHSTPATGDRLKDLQAQIAEVSGSQHSTRVRVQVPLTSVSP